MKPYNKNLKQPSRDLRNNMTEAEQLLWSRLRCKQLLGLQFYRQKPLLNYIVDFYCPAVNLVIECDGSQHYTEEGLNGYPLRIHKLKTDNYIELYRALESLSLPVSTYEIRRVLDNVKDITSGGTIKVSIADDIDKLKNSERILAISPKSKSSIEYTYTDSSQLIIDYFDIINDKSENLIKLIDEFPIAKSHWFPIFGFSSLVPDLQKTETLKLQQRAKLTNNIKANVERFNVHNLNSIEAILDSYKIPESYKIDYIFYKVFNDLILEDELKDYLMKIDGDLDSNYKKLLCLYDFKKYENP